jgi:hypothetical protein
MSTEAAKEFTSPKRALALSFRLSRDRWKAKAGKRRAEVRALKVRVRDLEASRDLWKQKAAHLQAQIDLLQAPAADPLPPSLPSSLSVPQVAPADPAACAPAACAPVAPPISQGATPPKKVRSARGRPASI